MLKSVELKNTASYGNNGQILDPLSLVNFIYGENGCGKSTIARLLKDSTEPVYNESLLTWESPEHPNIFVYDKDFVDSTLRETKVKGVFTLGEGSRDVYDELETCKDNLGKAKEKHQKLTENSVFYNDIIEKEEALLTGKCWDVFKEFENDFSPAFVGVSSSKKKFKSKALSYIDSSSDESYKDLLRQVKTFFSEQPERIDRLPTTKADHLKSFETSPAFEMKILGKEDVPISEFIAALGNSDWVHTGTRFLKDDSCPFCQQELPEKFKEYLDEYFDDTYALHMNEFKEAKDEYCALIKSHLNVLKGLQGRETDFFEFSSISNMIATVDAVFEKNMQLLSSKEKEPSLSVKLDSIILILNDIDEVLHSSNNEIDVHNAKITNIDNEKDRLIEKIWKVIGSRLRPSYDEFMIKADGSIKAYNNIKLKLDTIAIKIEELDYQKKILGKKLSSTTPSMDGINGILNSFGFDNFKIVEHSKEGFYQIQREDGTLAEKTLSEGERTFVAFLYFYQLVQGATSEEEISEPRIVVFDDPVSSLDSKVLFVVSTLVRSLFSSDVLNKLNIVQVFLMTHNVYFFKEVSFYSASRNNSYSLKKGDFGFWTVRKVEGKSIVTHHGENPVKTSYQLLWDELKECNSNPEASVTMCNVMRRILENYFKVLGGYDLLDFVDYFEGEEKLVFRSLISWIHDGSHCVFDGIDIGTNNEFAGRYFPVFKKVFKVTKHDKHFEMMMG